MASRKQESNKLLIERTTRWFDEDQIRENPVEIVHHFQRELHDAEQRLGLQANELMATERKLFEAEQESENDGREMRGLEEKVFCFESLINVN